MSKSIFLAAGLILAACLPAAADDLSDLDPHMLSMEEARYVQAALSVEGHYVGLIDGKVGPMTMKALDAYSKEVHGGPPEGWHLAALGYLFRERIDDAHWRVRYLPEEELSLALPEAHLVQTSDGQTRTWTDHALGLTVEAARHDRARSDAMHEALLDIVDMNRDCYVFRRGDRRVTSLYDTTGKLWYLRSDRIGNRWSTVTISVPDTGQEVLRAISSSIARGEAPDWALGEDSRLYAAMQEVGDRFAADPFPDPAPDPSIEPTGIVEASAPDVSDADRVTLADETR